MSERGEPRFNTTVTATDATTGESDECTIRDDYVIVCDGSAHVTNVITYANGTHVVTIKGCRRLRMPPCHAE